MLWLATRGRRLSLQAPSAADATQQRLVEPGPIAQSSGGDRREGKDGAKKEDGGRKESDAEAPVYASGDAGGSAGKIAASPVAIPAGMALPGRLNLARALRPFRQRRPSVNELELDEVRTVETTAELNGYVLPVFRPLRERWFDVDVVSEDDLAIALWRGASATSVRCSATPGLSATFGRGSCASRRKPTARPSDPRRLAYNHRFGL